MSERVYGPMTYLDWAYGSGPGTYHDSIRRNVTVTETKYENVTVRRVVDHDNGDDFRAVVYNGSGVRVGEYKTETGLMRRVNAMLANSGY